MNLQLVVFLMASTMLSIALGLCTYKFFKQRTPEVVTITISLLLLIGLTAVTSVPVLADDKKALFGELHIHTSWSMDAYIFNVRTSPDEAYRFAKGESYTTNLGHTYQMSRPLDFMAVTDHAVYMGAFKNMADPEHPFSKLDYAKLVTSGKREDMIKAFAPVRNSLRSGVPITNLDDPGNKKKTWDRMVEAANRHNDPGRFTTLIGYEWTASIDGGNMHRNVLFAGDSAPTPFTALQSRQPEDLWAWMDAQRANGHRLMAIPHNSNVSAGLMFDRKDTDGNALTADYAATRMRNELLVEVTQKKGTSETHPSLSPNDEFADFELVEQWIASNKPLTLFKGGYARDAWRTGLEFQDKSNFNPYRFGLIGSSDSHTGMVAGKERSFERISTDRSPETRMATETVVGMDGRKFGGSGLAGVWAAENTRGSVYGALASKETWATTGPRIRLRMYGGWDLSDVDPTTKDWAGTAAASGVPMGGELNSSDANGAPTFVVWALKDVEGANLDRVQIIKGWSQNGTSHERVYDVALSGDRTVDPDTGKAAPVGNSVNLETLEYTNDIGATQLSAIWTDPEFDASRNAFYYARVLEIPIPRWSTYDAKELGISVPKDLPATIQERAFGSPIWYDVK